MKNNLRTMRSSAWKLKIFKKTQKKFKVVMCNDNVTTMDFVVNVLIRIFHKNAEEANDLMMTVHQNGETIVGIYNYEIAVTKAEQAHNAAKAKNFPLRCIVESN